MKPVLDPMTKKVTLKEWLCTGEPTNAAIKWLRNEEFKDRLFREPKLCDGCEQNIADPPSNFCPGCQAYREHQR